MYDILLTDHNEGKIRPKLTEAVFNKEVCNAEISLLRRMDYLPLTNVLCFCLDKDISKGKCEKQSKKW